MRTKAAMLLRHGGVVDTICKVREEVGADLLIMGTHARTGLRRLVLGSVAEEVLRRSVVPVVRLSEMLLAVRRVPSSAVPSVGVPVQLSQLRARVKPVRSWVALSAVVPESP